MSTDRFNVGDVIDDPNFSPIIHTVVLLVVFSGLLAACGRGLQKTLMTWRWLRWTACQ
jgi:hypothetical protein